MTKFIRIINKVNMQAFDYFQLFKKIKLIVIGMIHIKALPGTPRSKLNIGDIVEKACFEAELYKAHKLDGVMIENMHDVPYCHTKDIGPEITAAMTIIGSKVKQICKSIPCGIQILAGANEQALAAALAADLQFIRAEGFIYAHVADEGLMNACAGKLLRYRKQINAEHIMIFTDVKKKHSSHAITQDVDIVQMAKDAEFCKSDGIILTGEQTESAADAKEVKRIVKATKLPVLIGSGMSSDNLENYIDANGFIVGSFFKKNGHWSEDLDEERIQKFMDTIHQMRGKYSFT